MKNAGKEPPRPLLRDIPPAGWYPIDALNGELKDASIAIQDKTQTPMAICAQSVLGAATLVVQAHADVILPTGQRRPISNYFVTVAESGERKSSCDTEALRPVRKREEKLRGKRDAAWLPYRNAKEAWEVSRKQAVARTNRSPAQKQDALDALGPEPVAPLGEVAELVVGRESGREKDHVPRGGISRGGLERPLEIRELGAGAGPYVALSRFEAPAR